MAPTRPAAVASRRILINKQPTGATTSDAPAERHTARTAAFTPEQFTQAWQHYIEQNPGEIILLSAMRNSVPQRLNDTTYQVEVENTVSTMAKTDREIVEDMRDRNPQFAQMIKDFKLSMT